LQTHEISLSTLPEASQNIHTILLGQQQQNYETYQSISRRQHEMFLIRNDFVNQFEEVLKKAIGDRMHLMPILPERSFSQVQWREGG